MPLIGNPAEFAVELDLRSEPAFKPWLYGQFCLWIGGARLGSPVVESTLNSVLAGLQWWKETRNDRQSNPLMCADLPTSFFSIEAALYGTDHLDGRLPADFEPILIDRPARFEVFELDGLDNCRIYCVENASVTRLLYDDTAKSLHECRVSRQYFDGVMTEAVRQLEEWSTQA